MADAPLVEALRAALAPEASWLRVALLFGSAARGALHPASDVDIGIVPVDPGIALPPELDLQSRLERMTRRRVDLVRLDRADGIVRWEAARAGVVLLSSPPGEAARLLAEIALEHADLAPLVEAGAERWRRALLARGAAK